MRELDSLLNELVIANRILSHENIVDAYGHVSVRHPENPSRFLLARSLSPDLVERDNIMEFNLDGEAISDDRTRTRERFIHSAIYEARPDVHAVVHAMRGRTALQHQRHSASEPVIRWGVSSARTCRSGTSRTISAIPISWFGMGPRHNVARSLDGHNVALMRGHGFAAAARSLAEVVRTAVYLPRNARASSPPCSSAATRRCQQAKLRRRRPQV